MYFLPCTILFIKLEPEQHINILEKEKNLPVYTFRDKKTKKEFTLTMSMKERETYLQDNPQIEQLLTTINIADPIRLGVTKPPADFQKNVIGRMKSKIHGNTLGNSRFNIPKEI